MNVANGYKWQGSNKELAWLCPQITTPRPQQGSSAQGCTFHGQR